MTWGSDSWGAANQTAAQPRPPLALPSMAQPRSSHEPHPAAPVWAQEFSPVPARQCQRPWEQRQRLPWCCTGRRWQHRSPAPRLVAVPPRRQGGISLIRASIHHSTKVSETRREALRTGNFKSTAKEMLHQYLLASSSRRKRSCLVDISTCAALGRTHCYQLVSCSHRVSESVGIIISNLCTVCKQSCTQKTSCSSLHPR